MLSCLVPRFQTEDISLPSSSKFDLQFAPMATGMLSNRNEDESSQQTNSNSSECMNCPQCQLEFNSPQAFKEHIMQVHQPSPSMTQQHFSSPPPTMISPGNLYTGDEGGRLSHSPNQLNAHACSHNHCSASFPTIDLLEKHEIINHSSGASSVCCRLCQKTFANVYRLQRHMISHDESALLRKFKCSECDKAFKFKHHLKEHLRIHSGEKPFQCTNCGKRFSHSGSYSSHMTSKKCISMGLKMNGMSGANPLMNGNMSSVNQMNVHKMKSEKKQQGSSAMGQNFMNQSLAAVENFMKNNGVLSNPNLFLPMIPNLHDIRKYENYGVMNAALFASLSNPFQMNLNPYHIQNLLKLSGVPNLNLPMDDESQKALDDEQKSPNDRHSNPEDLIEEVNENEESKLVMDIDYDEKPLKNREDNNNDNEDRNDSDEDELMSNIEHHDLSPKHDSHEKSPSPSPSSIKQEHNEDESQNDSLRCQHCDKVFNHPAEHLQHETVLCSSLMMKKHEGLMMHMVDAMNNSNSNMNMNEDDTDDRESKISTESERKVRVRTAISEDQQTILKEFYAINPRPNREDFRNIAQRLMLDARVVQVWFQNNRSRERKQNGVGQNFKQENNVSSIMSGNSSSNEEQPLDLSIKREMMTDTPTTSPRYGVVPMQQSNDTGAINLSRKMTPFSPIFQPNFNTDFLTRQIPSPNEAGSHLPTAAARNGMTYNLPLGLPLERLLHFTPEMARNPLLMMKSDPRSPANSLSPGSSEKRSWKDDESRSFDELSLQQAQPYHPQRRMPKMKSEIPPDSSEFQFVCDLCDKAFRKQSSLARHKYEHSGQRPFKCVECPKAFKHRHHLTEHKRLHSGEKPFQCSKCLKRFSHSGSYSQHMNHRYSYCKPYRD